MTATIALVDDDRNILTSVSIALQAEGFLTRVYSDGETALKALIENPPDLAIFDIKMPRMDGLELLRRLREKSTTPVIFLTSKDDELDEALGLAMGADDYIAKPFSQRLLIARIRAILRRAELAQGGTGETDEAAAENLVRGRLAMDPARHRVTWGGTGVTLTVTEFLILETLAQRPGIVKTRNQLMDAAYQDDIYVDDRTIDSHIKRVRRKFRQVDPEFDAIETLYGAGYRFSEESDDRDLTLRWSGRVSLTRRILAVNIFALALLAGGFFYLDSYRSRIVDGRVAQASREVRLIAEALSAVPLAQRDLLTVRLAHDTRSRIRLFDSVGRQISDSRSLGLRNFVLVDPDKEPWQQDIARFLDAMIDTVVGAARAPLYREVPPETGLSWPDVRTALAARTAPATVWRAPDRTPVITAAAALPAGGAVMTTINARDITQTVRIERFRLSVVLLIVTIVSILLSLFLARTIVRPLRRLARAAVRVRLGRAREVVVPRLPSRGDEIGMLARALSDMSLALRARIDATEAFAADVTHELKNPLASLRSAVEGLSSVRDPELQERLLAIVRDDVHRLDRLISDISEASRLDAQLSRAKFEAMDVGAMVAALLATRAERGTERGIRIVFDRRPDERLITMGEGARLERVFENLIDNAISFSPDNGLITIAAGREGDELAVRIEDEGPGVPEEAREAVFRRFQSIRPESEAFGKHSGLGLAIARTIVEGHQGTIAVESREDRLGGARFVVKLPLADNR